MSTLPQVIALGLEGDIPAAGHPGRLYFASDTDKIWRDNGATWDDVTPSATGAVTSVNSQTGVVALTTADVPDSADKRYVTDAELAVVAATSGVNTGDQNLSGYQLKSEKDAASGYASLDGDVLIPVAEIPPLDAAKIASGVLDPARIPPTNALSSSTVLVSGGGVAWITGYEFRVSAASYLILGAAYSSAQADVTLTAAHATEDRIDVIAVDDSGVVVVLEGAHAVTPVQPIVDPAHQLALTFVLVTHATSQPVAVTSALIYDETGGGEWTPSTSGATWATASTNNPYSGSKDIEATTVPKGAYVQLQAAAPVDLSAYGNLVLYLRSKAPWSSQRYLSLTWLSAGVQKGVAVVVKEGSFGFASANTTTYQQIIIPLSQFGAISGTITQLRVSVAGGGGTATLGFYLDNLNLQAGVDAALPTELYVDAAVLTGTINGVNDTFTLPHTPSPLASLQLFYKPPDFGALLMIQGVDYTIVGSTITMTTIPDTGGLLRAFYRY